MTPGLTARLGRVGTAGRHLVVPMDHGITLGPVAGLVELEATVAADARCGVHRASERLDRDRPR
jgi:fructose-bisphosphate aldolase/2-amino-3,7-dideoxy-D-threo-hept-6-ulosonate synthase